MTSTLHSQNVHVEASRTCSKGFHLDVTLVDLDIQFRRFREYSNGCCTGVNATSRFR